jgi:MinD-like ATPase involved in chromosome partitioning or flagellar assembly
MAETGPPPTGRARERAAVRVVFAGTSGGVGTTTATALVFAALQRTVKGAPTLTDHTGGTLGARLPLGDECDAVDAHLVLHDLGAHAHGEGIDLLESPATLLAITTASTPTGIAAATELLTDITARYGIAAMARVSIVASQTNGRHDVSAESRRLFAAHGRTMVYDLPADPALAVGGRIPLNRLRRRTRDAQIRLAKHLDEVARRFHQARA